ncbi:DUF1642 domain-containing protein [Paucilactobacillus kaifaensis]|uniref:DUF1642 domain-containing protein n=1 Tax=Paucilactobacillus kaifaensis TaxID=2559921 RepID=UPI0010F88EA8|nr:DUF1642 domain-containing protein [Paucilactobacillus kaifaensis]
MKYKVGDEVLVKGKVYRTEPEDNELPYSVVCNDNGVQIWPYLDNIVDPTEKVKVPKWFDEWYHSTDGYDNNDVQFINILSDTDIHELRYLEHGTAKITTHSFHEQDRVKFISAIINGYEVEKEKLYRIPLPNLKTSDGYQQYLSRRSKRNGHWFASRRQSNLIQAFTKAEIEQVPDAYKQYVVEVEPDENS